MAARKRTVTQEPLLSTVARKLGHAAGTLTKVTQELADNVSAVPETVAAKVREAARATKIGELKIGGSNIGESAGIAREGINGTPEKSFPAPSGHAEPEQARPAQSTKRAVATAAAATAQSESQAVPRNSHFPTHACCAPRSRSADRRKSAGRA
jgi:hypothetical protein